MKSIIEYLTINEAAAKDINIPRKGSTVYLLKEGNTKAIPVKVTDVEKVKNSWYGHSGGYDVYITLADNTYGFTGWTTNHYNRADMDAPIQVKSTGFNDAIYYIGTSKEAISEYIKNRASVKLEGVLRNIKELEDKLMTLNIEKDKLEIIINSEITESLEGTKI